MMRKNDKTYILHCSQFRSSIRMPELILGIYIFCYFLVSLSFLTNFPFVHSDEAWLSGLTRNMVENGDLEVTETFYNLKPRYPHAIKIIFHLLQMPMLVLFQYRIFSFRLLSLIFGCIALILFYVLLKAVFDKAGGNLDAGLEANAVSGWYPLLGTMFLSVDIQFIYASHFARQEIILVCCIIADILAVLKKRPLAAGVITGLSVGLHPNSFLLGTMCTAMLLPTGSEKQRPPGNESENRKRFAGWKPLLRYVGITSAFAAFFVALSLSFDRNFFRHYMEYGNSEFDIGAPATDKLTELPYFFTKIWYGVSGTYYVPDVRLEFILFGLAAAFLTIMAATGKTGHRVEIVLVGKGALGMLAGMVLIGRYNQTSIVFLFPLFFILVLMAVNGVTEMIRGRKKWGHGTKTAARNLVIIVLTAAVAFLSGVQIAPWVQFRYAAYIGEIAEAVGPDRKVLANLNSDYYFQNGKLLDYRNLSYLKDGGLSVEDYVKKNKIEYIILSDEMDLIYSQRPLWNIIYGNPRYMEELHRFLDENCTPVYNFRDNIYGIRIVQYMNSDRDFTVQIFKVKDLS